MPAFVDPNTGIKLWESGAIIEYLLDVYDEEKRLSYETWPEKYEQNCWKHFQMSGQGPYFGQVTWFLYVRIPSTPSQRENSKRTDARLQSFIMRPYPARKSDT